MTHSFKLSLACAVTALFLCAPAAQAASIKAYDPDNPSRIVPINEYPELVDKLIVRKNFDLAQTVIEEGLKQNPLSVQLRFQRCVLFERMGQKDRARELLEDFITRYPEIPEPYNNLAAIYSSVGNLDRAEELLKKCLALRPNFALAHANLGNLYLARSKNAFATSLQLAPQNASIRKKIQELDKLLR